MKSLLIGMLGLCFALPTTALGQETPEREQLEVKLRRDQQSILRKAERLRDLMATLRTQYQKEGRARQVELLDKGLAHLKAIGLLENVAGVRDALDARALSRANQKAEKIVNDLEALLLILLDRPSMEKIEEEIAKTRKLEASAAELEQRQSELLQKNRDTSERSLTDTERELAAELQRMARMQQEEAEQNMREAGTRQPFLESALRRVQALERERARLATELKRQRENPDARDPAREQMFDIGALKEQTIQQMKDRARQRSMERVGDSARRLSQAMDRQDAADMLDAKDELRGEMDRAKKSQNADLAEAIETLQKELEAAKSEDLGALVKKIETRADEATKQQQTANNLELDKLAEAAADTAKKFDRARKAQKRKPGQPEKNLAGAAKDLQNAALEGKKDGRTQKTLAHLSQALRKLDEARAGVQRRNPSTERRAGQMATNAAEAARELRESPGAKPEGNAKKPGQPELPTENRAAQKLDEVEKAMRDAAKELESESKDRKNGRPTDREQRRRTDQKLEQTKKNLAEARRALENELRQNGQSKESRQRALQRQEQLSRQTQNMRDRMKNSREQGELSRQQQSKADQALQRAKAKMQQAKQSMQGNQQSRAAQQQQDASEQLDKAREELQRNRPLNDDQKQALKEQAKEQKQLADDIMKLAKLAEERKNQRAQQALDRAQEKAREAADELEEGDDDEAQKKQEEALEALKEAQEELKEERERYEDLRQEELLFKIQEELKQLLARQEPITAKTEAAGAALAKNGRLSRRARRRLNVLSDEEQELKTKAEFMRKALEEEEVLVFSHAIKSSEQDLAEIKKRLAGSRPQPDEVTVVLQKDVEDRTRKLIAALKREQKRRQEQRKKNQQPKDPNQRQNNNQNRRQRLVSITAELEMLKQMEEDMLKRTQFMEKLINARGDDVSEVDLALLERLTHRHTQITEIFLALKKQVEDAINPQPEGEALPDKDDDGGGGKKDGGK